jgi:hypothetical protein
MWTIIAHIFAPIAAKFLTDWIHFKVKNPATLQAIATGLGGLLDAAGQYLTSGHVDPHFAAYAGATTIALNEIGNSLRDWNVPQTGAQAQPAPSGTVNVTAGDGSTIGQDK